MKSAFSLCLCLFLSWHAFGQKNEFNFQRPILGPTEQWHILPLPNDIYGKIAEDLSDLRVKAITPENDTIEAPYLLQLARDERKEEQVGFNIINQSREEYGYHFTFEGLNQAKVNQFILEFGQSNYDWRLSLEGSQDLENWETLLEDYRILSIKNDYTSYTYNKVNFPDAKYKYFRVSIPGLEQPELKYAKLSLASTAEGAYRTYAPTAIVASEDKKKKQSIVDIKLEHLVPMSSLSMAVGTDLDYHRNIKIMSLYDSVKTEKGWIPQYKSLYSGTLSSMEKAEFKMGQYLVKELRFIVDNQDNAPLPIGNFVVKGYVHNLVIRLSETAEYYLFYGSEKRIKKPLYDIQHFENKIPENLTALELGVEKQIEHEEVEEVKPLFERKIWLWVVMVLILLFLSIFTIRMIRKA